MAGISVFEYEIFTLFKKENDLHEVLNKDYYLVVLVVALDFSQTILAGAIRGIGQ